MMKALLKLHYKVKKWVKQKQEQHGRELNMNYEIFFNRPPLTFVDTEWGKKARKLSDIEYREEYSKWIGERNVCKD